MTVKTQWNRKNTNCDSWEIFNIVTFEYLSSVGEINTGIFML